MKIALASPPFPANINDGLYWVEKLVKDAAAQQAVIICFPESYIPGYPGMGYAPEERTPENLQAALDKVCAFAAQHKIAVIIPMDWYGEEGLLNTAFVVDANGKVLGAQTKNQLDPTEDDYWVAGTTRTLFEVAGLKFGITICHEGFRYPESVRWAAQQGAHIVFHPQFSGSNTEGVTPVEWRAKENAYYETADMMRAMENTIYIGSSNYASKYPEAASALVSPTGQCLGHGEYGVTGVTVIDIDLSKATGLLAKRFKNRLYA